MSDTSSAPGTARPTIITPTDDGPLEVDGPVSVRRPDGTVIRASAPPDLAIPAATTAGPRSRRRQSQITSTTRRIQQNPSGSVATRIILLGSPNHISIPKLISGKAARGKDPNPEIGRAHV